LIVRGAELRDTVLAPNPFVEIAVVDSAGRPAASIPVRFEVPRGADGRFPAAVYHENGYGGGPILTDTTDALGHLTVQVFLARPTESAVRIMAASLGATTDAKLTILPGSPVRVVAGPDTGLYLGASTTLHGNPVDRFDNRVNLPVTFRAIDDAIVTASGSTVSARSLGTGRIVVTYAQFADTVRVSVVPRGVLAIRRQYELAQVNLDGSGYRVLASTPPPNGPELPEWDAVPRWNPSGTTVAYHDPTVFFSGIGAIYLSDGNGAPHRVFPTTLFAIELYPDWSPDGAWIYFGARLRDSIPVSLWRSHPDGSGLERLPDAPDRATFEIYETHPAISPDGQWVTYESRQVYGSTPRLRVRRISTGVRTALDTRGASARWSPDGETIAYIDNDATGGALMLTNRDGSNTRRLSSSVFAGELDWSPDGRYILAYGGFPTSLALVEVATGTLTYVPYLYDGSPSWRR
jgi:hypothetical protein